ncbi:MAG TPA: hypothetical protein VII52_10010 [Gemmatimonadaceae bacterium]
MIKARMVLDGAGRQWRIAEMTARVTADGSAGQCLVLSTANRCVRLSSYPDQWLNLSVEELCALDRARTRDNADYQPTA